MAAAVAVGGTSLPWSVFLDAVSGRDTPEVSLLLRLRAPRVVLAALVGGLLSGAGCVLQTVLRNPLADPYLLGVSGGAALGAVMGVGLGTAFPAVWAVSGAGVALAFVLGVARGREGADPVRLVLAGAAFHSVASSLMTLLLFRMSGRPESSGLYFWLLGSLTVLPWTALALLAVLAAVVLGALAAWAPTWNVLALGRDGAASLGVAAPRAMWGALLLAAAATGLAVSFNGMIPFAGLLAPHAARALAKSHRLERVLPLSVLVGALVVTAADAAGRWCLAPREIPTGVVAALAGAPLFLLLLKRKARP
jgi:iron complex transport system permease protein